MDLWSMLVLQKEEGNGLSQSRGAGLLMMAIRASRCGPTLPGTWQHESYIVATCIAMYFDSGMVIQFLSTFNNI